MLNNVFLFLWRHLRARKLFVFDVDVNFLGSQPVPYCVLAVNDIVDRE